MMCVPEVLTAGATSTQYLVQAASRPSNPRRSKITVMLGCRDATRFGEKSVMHFQHNRAERRRLCRYNEDMYSAELLDHFEHPRYAGELPTANTRIRVENPACGDVLELAADVQDGTVAAIRFRAKGCVPAMACGSAIASLIQGKPVAQLLSIRKEDVLREVEAVPPASGHAIHLALDAVSQLWNAIQKTATSTRSAP